MTALLRVEQVSKRFGGYLALSGVQMDIAEGSIHALIGPNGAGKTTLFNIVSGMTRPSGGRLVFANKDYSGCRADAVLRMGVARNFQQVRLFGDLDVVENVMIGSHVRLGGRPWRDLVFMPFRTGIRERAERVRAERMLDFVGLTGRTSAAVGDLTLVEQRRLEIARALASDPRLLLLDEPAAGMNPAEVWDLIELVQRIRDGGITVLLIEHQMRLVMTIAERITVLNAGRVIKEGPPDAVQRDATVIAAYLGEEA